MSLLGRLFGGRKKTPEEEAERMMDRMRRAKETLEQKARMIDSLKIARVEICERVYQNVPEHLRNDKIAQAIAEQVNYATASSQFEGDDEAMRRKLEALVAEFRLNWADKAASELISAVKMRPHYLSLAESIMR